MSEITRKYKLLWVALAVLVGLNIWLLYGRIKLQRQVNRLQAEVLQKAGTVSVASEPIQFKGPKSASQKPVELVAFFTDYGCTHCVQSEISYLNEWDATFPGTLSIYYEGTSEGYLENFGATFKYQKIKSTRSLFNVAVPVGNPITAIVDENGNVQAMHTNDLSRPGSDRRRTNFYQLAESLFSSVYTKQ